MIEIDKGHLFNLETLDTEFDSYVHLVFVKRTGSRYPGNSSSYPGTTSQEVLRALIARAKYVNGQIPCWETRASIWLYRTIIFLYEWRAKKVKSKWLSPIGFSRIEFEPTCPQCGHIRCKEQHDLYKP